MAALGPIVPTLGCTFSPTLSEDVCSATGVYHLAFGDDGAVACEAHWPVANAMGFTDWHLFDHRCVLAQLVGGVWVPSTDCERGHCEPDEQGGAFLSVVDQEAIA